MKASCDMCNITYHHQGALCSTVTHGGVSCGVARAELSPAASRVYGPRGSQAGDRDQPWTTNVLALPERLEQDRFSSAVIFLDLTTTALLWPSVPFGAGPVMASGTNQK